MEGATASSRTCTVPRVPGTLQALAQLSQTREGLARTMAAAGLGLLDLVRTVSTFGTCSISLYCKGGFEQKTSTQAACLLLSVSPSADKDQVRTADRISRILKHPDKGGSPDLAAKIY
uniref:J domain-containing protein n=1 Tax=Taeniopygia guttata TaxID=59729 RepID=A0A674HQ45_TAEGU